MIATVDFASLQDPQGLLSNLKSRTTRPNRRAFESCRIPAAQGSCWPVPLALAFTMRVRVRVRVRVLGGDRVGLRIEALQAAVRGPGIGATRRAPLRPAAPGRALATDGHTPFNLTMRPGRPGPGLSAYSSRLPDRAGAE
jgi:hypothetical protein